MNYADRIRAKITADLAPVRLDLIDQSDRHAGHAGHAGGGETHFDLTVVSAAFEGVGRLARQRRILDLLAEELREQVHALSIRALTPAEDAAAPRPTGR
jgi:BolA protein